MATITVTVPDLSSLPHSRPRSERPRAKNVSPGLSLFAGSIAGGVEAATTYPFEFAKTRAQLRSHVQASSNPFTILTQVTKTEGLGAVYAGCSTLIAGTALKAGVRFLTFDVVKQALADNDGRLSPVRGVMAGMAAGCVESILAVTPTERIKTALIDDAKHEKRFRGGMHAFTTIIRESGIGGLYRGLLATCIKQSATSAVRMGSYNMLKTIAAEQKVKSSAHNTFAMGSIAGVITVYATQPFDTIKTRTQSAHGATVREAVADILNNKGIKGLWSGSTMRLGRLVFSGGIVFTVYEQIIGLVNSQSR